ncbi:hypothetical protein Tco_0515259, partial [Tanacetum coccineum]
DAGNNVTEEGAADGQEIPVDAGIVRIEEEVPTTIPEKAKGSRKKRKDVGGANDSNLPPKKLRADHGTFGVSASTGGKYVVALQSLLECSTLLVEVGVTAVATLPFITSYVSLTLEREGGGRTDSVTGPNLHTQHPTERFVVLSDYPCHSSSNVADAEVSFVIRSLISDPPIMTTAIATTVVVVASSIPVPRAGDEPAHASIFVDSTSADMAHLPPHDQRHLWLHYQVEGYTDEIVHHFEQRLETLFKRQLGGDRRSMTWRQFIQALGLHTAEEMAEDGFEAYWLGSERVIPDKGDLSDYWVGISSGRDFLRGAPYYTYIRDPLRRMCHRLISYSIFGKGHAPEKVTATGPFYYIAMSQRACAFSAASCPSDVEDAPDIDDGAQAIPAPIHAPLPPPPVAGRTIPQRLGRLEEEIQGLRQDVRSLRGLMERSMTDQGRFSIWMVATVKDAEATRVNELNGFKEWNSALEEEKNALEHKVVALESVNAAKVTELTSLTAQTTKLTQDLSELGLSCDELSVKASSLKAERDRLVGQVSLQKGTCFELRDEVSAGRRWILGRSLRLMVMKCLQSPRYLVALGGAIGHAIDKGMQDGLAAGIDHGKDRRGLVDLASQKDTSIVDIMGLLYLDGPVAKTLEADQLQLSPEQLILPIHRPKDQVVIRETSLSFSLDVVHARVRRIRGDDVSQRFSIFDAMVPPIEPLSAENLVGEASMSGVPAAVAATTTLSTTFVQASSVPPIPVSDYEVADTEA